MAVAPVRFTRRTLLSGATASAIGASSAAAALREQRYDVVVVGAGAAGLAAALGARRADPACSIVVLEAKPDVGGTSAPSGRRVWIPNNADMRAAVFPHPTVMPLRYIARLAYPA